MPEPSPTVEVYLSVGANIEPRKNIIEALRRLQEMPDTLRVKQTSTFYRTAPIGRPEQPFFLNGVWKISTIVAARALKYEVLRPIEESLGRRRTPDAYASRPIDLDLLLYGDQVIDEPGLKLPSEDIYRPFVAAGLLELAPELIVPGLGRKLVSLVEAGDLSDMIPEMEFTKTLKEILQ